MAMPSIRVNGSPSMSMRSAKVPLSPSSALTHTYFCGGVGLRDRAPLDAGGEAGAAAAAQPGGEDLVDAAGGPMPRARRSPARPPCAT